MLLQLASYEQSVVNHKTARASFEKFADTADPSRVFWLDGASSMGKSYLLEWFERSIKNCEVIRLNLSDNASLQFVLFQLADAVREAKVDTPAFDALLKPKQLSSHNEISGLSIVESPHTNVNLNVDYAQNSDEMLVIYAERVRALADDVKLTLQRHDLPHFVIMFDQMERYDHATNSFIYRVLAPTLYALPCFQFVFAGHNVIDRVSTVPSKGLQDHSLKVTLTRFTNPQDIAEYLRTNAGGRVSGRDLNKLAEDILAECQGMPSLVGKFVRIFCGGTRE